MQQRIPVTAVTVSLPEPAVMIKLDKQIWIGTMLLWNEPHYHSVPVHESMVDGLDNLESYLTLNGWPNITPEDRATLLNVTNAARGVSEQRITAE